MSRQKKSERNPMPGCHDGAKPKGSLPLTVARPELLHDDTDRDFRKLVHNLFAFMTPHETIRDGHARPTDRLSQPLNGGITTP